MYKKKFVPPALGSCIQCIWYIMFSCIQAYVRVTNCTHGVWPLVRLLLFGMAYVWPPVATYCNAIDSAHTHTHQAHAIQYACFNSKCSCVSRVKWRLNRLQTPTFIMFELFKHHSRLAGSCSFFCLHFQSYLRQSPFDVCATKRITQLCNRKFWNFTIATGNLLLL